jgi:hypothetical protein
MRSRRLEIRSEFAIRIESRGILTWVRLLGPMALAPLVYIRFKAYEDYGPKMEPTKDRLEYGNYIVK